MLSKCLTAAIALLFAVAGANAADAAKPKNMAEALCGTWKADTSDQKGALQVSFDKTGAFTEGTFYGNPIKTFKIKTASPLAFELKYDIVKMKGMTGTVQFKDGKFGTDFRTIDGTVSSMLAKGKLTWQKEEVAAEKK
jgi:hypothetical protein